MKTRGVRHNAREFALRILFGYDQHHDPEFPIVDNLHLSSWEEDDSFGMNHESEQLGRQFALQTIQNRHDIDELIQSHSKNWRIPRMPIVDRNILRLAIWELKHESSTPSQVVIDEALELAKCYGEEKSTQFINGILDPIATKLRGANDS